MVLGLWQSLSEISESSYCFSDGKKSPMSIFLCWFGFQYLATLIPQGIHVLNPSSALGRQKRCLVFLVKPVPTIYICG